MGKKAYAAPDLSLQDDSEATSLPQYVWTLRGSRTDKSKEVSLPSFHTGWKTKVGSRFQGQTDANTGSIKLYHFLLLIFFSSEEAGQGHRGKAKFKSDTRQTSRSIFNFFAKELFTCPFSALT